MAEGGGTEAAVTAAGLHVHEGLRIKSLNGVEMYNAPKSAVVQKMKATDFHLHFADISKIAPKEASSCITLM